MNRRSWGSSSVSSWGTASPTLVSEGRLSTRPRAPSSLCSTTSTTVRQKFGSSSAGPATSSCPRTDSIKHHEYPQSTGWPHFEAGQAYPSRGTGAQAGPVAAGSPPGSPPGLPPGSPPAAGRFSGGVARAATTTAAARRWRAALPPRPARHRRDPARQFGDHLEQVDPQADLRLLGSSRSQRGEHVLLPPHEELRTGACSKGHGHVLTSRAGFSETRAAPSPLAERPLLLERGADLPERGQTSGALNSA